MEYVLSDPYSLAQTEDAKKIGNGIVVDDSGGGQFTCPRRKEGKGSKESINLLASSIK